MYYTGFLNFLSKNMPLELISIRLKELKNDNQTKFNEMIIEANLLADQWLQSGFTPDILMPDKWEPLFLQSNFYTLYKEFFAPFYPVNDPGKIFVLFTSAFDCSYGEGENPTFNTSHLVLFLNQELDKTVNGLFFEYIDPNASVDLEFEDGRPNTPSDAQELKRLDMLTISDSSLYIPSHLKDKKIIKSAINKNMDFLDGISMQVLSGFLTVIGVAALALSFALLNTTTFGIPGIIFTGLGVTALLTGLGLFGTTKNSCNSAENIESLDSQGLNLF